MFGKDKQATKVAAAPAAPKEKRTAANITFGRGSGPPVFRKGNAKVAINKNEFPDLGDFPTMGSEKNSTSKAQESTGPACDKPHVGMFTNSSGSGGMRAQTFGNSFATAPATADEEKGISFGKKPTFTSSRSKVTKPLVIDQEVNDRQNYDFSKMTMASASTRRPGEEVKREEGEEGEAMKEATFDTEEQKPMQQREKRAQPIAFDADEAATRKYRPEAAQEDDDGFVTFTRDKRQNPAPARSVAPGWKPPTAASAAPKNNRFDSNWGE